MRPLLVALACSAAVLSCSTPRMNNLAAPMVKSGSPVERALQLVVVTTSGWDVTTGVLRQFTRADASSAWSESAPPTPVVIGRTGLAWSDAALASEMGQPVKREGDGRSPAGAFPLDTAFGFASQSEVPWIRLAYAPLTAGSDCVDDEQSAYYNTVVDRATTRVDWKSAEHMRSISVYRIGVIVGYNANPPVRGRGSCIFLHIWGGPTSTTAGCTALDATALEALVRWLDPNRRPMIVQLPRSEYARLRTTWNLPAE